LLRLAGALVGGFALAIPATILIVPRIETIYPLGVLFFVVMFSCAYVFTGSERIAYAGMQAAIVFNLTLLPEAMQTVALNPVFTRAVTVFLGSLVSVLVVRFAWPLHASREVRAQLAGALRDCGVLFHAFTERVVSGADLIPRADELQSAIKAGLDKSVVLLSEATLEADDPGLRSGQGLVLIEAVETIFSRLRAVGSALEIACDPALYHQIASELNQLDRAVGPVLQDLAACLRAGGDISELRDLASGLRAIDQQLIHIRESGSTRNFPAEQMVFLSLIERIKEFIQAVLDVAKMLAGRTP
jgi:uncharacterized membrane protein YccC